MISIVEDIDLVFGSIFCFMDDSRVKRWYPPDFMFGRITITSSITPTPPIQWVRLRQKRIDLGKISMLPITVAPVVVNPDIDSKKALINPDTDSLKR
jgi:hypothetical protein